jgi:hypothetical protein
VIITYERPDTLDPQQLDPEAPAADLSPTGHECGTTTYDVAGLEWHCTRAPHPGDDEHQAAFERGGEGPEGAVGFAWTYQYATDAPSDSIDHAAPTHGLTVTLRYPERAARGINSHELAASMIRAALDHFWEGDQDDVTATITTTP